VAGSDQEQGQSLEDWRAALPEDIRDKPTWGKFEGEESFVEVPEGLLRSHLNLEGMLGDRNKMPETPEEQKEFYTKLGWEPDFEKYSKGIERAEMPEGIEYDTHEEQFLLQLAHESKVPLSVAKEKYDKVIDARLKAIEDEKALREQYLEKRTEANHAKHGNDLSVIQNRAKAVITDYDSPEFLNILENAEFEGLKLGDHPDVIDFFAKLGKEKLGVGDERGKQSPSETSETIQEEINTLMIDPAYSDADHINHDAAVNKMKKLFQRLHGEI